MKLRNVFKLGKQRRKDQKETPPQCRISWANMKKLGFRFSGHPQDKLLLEEVTKSAFSVFAEEIRFPALDAVFIYRRSEQDAEHDHIEGYANYCEFEDGSRSYVLGISVEALERGEGYAAATICHELAHIEIARAGGDITAHDETFDKAVKRHIHEYEKATGQSLDRFNATGEKLIVQP